MLRAMTAVFVHGVPDTHRVWDPVLEHIERRDVLAVDLPGFDSPVPAGFGATKEEYVAWLIAELEKLEGPSDLVGQDWGAILVARVASIRPDLVRTLACGGAALSSEYVWHDMAQQWQTPGAGEAVMQAMTPPVIGPALAAAGVPEAYANEAAQHVDATMKDCILKLYRSAVTVGREWEPDLAKVTSPALVLWGEHDPYGAASFADKLGEKTRASKVVKFDCGHWWQLQKPADVAHEIQEFWQQHAA
jgi:pimeloyl-ACP methyl ester carboxylesterase